MMTNLAFAGVLGLIWFVCAACTYLLIRRDEMRYRSKKLPGMPWIPSERREALTTAAWGPFGLLIYWASRENGES